MTTKLARVLSEGDMIDLHGDGFASASSPLCLSYQDWEDHLSTVNGFQYEYAEVENIEHETNQCIVVHTSLTSFACPPDHELKLMPAVDDFKAQLAEQNERMRELDLEED